MDLSHISHRGWLSIVTCLIGVISTIIFFIAYYGIEYSTPVSDGVRIKIALAIVAIVVVGGIGSFYAILYRNKILNPRADIEDNPEEDSAHEDKY